jgi:hypothetical protein
MQLNHATQAVFDIAIIVGEANKVKREITLLRKPSSKLSASRMVSFWLDAQRG